MNGETGMSLAVAGRKRQTVQTARRLAECSENGGCDREWATAGCWQTVRRDVQLQREGHQSYWWTDGDSPLTISY